MSHPDEFVGVGDDGDEEAEHHVGENRDKAVDVESAE